MAKKLKPSTATDLPTGKSPTTETNQNSRFAVERLHRIDEALHERKFQSCADLMERCGVSKRTILRDIEFLRDRWHLPIETDPMKGYYYSEEVVNLPSVKMGENDFLELCLAAKALEAHRGMPQERMLQSVVKKLSELLPKSVTIGTMELDSVISFRPSGAAGKIDLGMLAQIFVATRDCEELHYDYLKPQDSKPEQRKVQPTHLTAVDGAWYLFAYDIQRRGMRLFYVGRIFNLSLTGKTFPRRKFDVKKHLEDSFGLFAGTPVKVRLRFDPIRSRIISERVYHRSQNLTQLQDGTIEMTLQVSDCPELEAWVLSWGASVQVLEPTTLAERVLEHARRIVDRG